VLSSVPINIAIPAWSKEQVSLLNSTAVGFLIAVPELMAKAKSIAAQTYDPIGSDLAVARRDDWNAHHAFPGLKWKGKEPDPGRKITETQVSAMLSYNQAFRQR
jgi:hypothetical protein